MTTIKPKTSFLDVDEVCQDLTSAYSLFKSVHSFVMNDLTSQSIMMEQGINNLDDLLLGEHPKLLKTIITRWHEALSQKFQSLSLSEKCENLGIQI